MEGREKVEDEGEDEGEPEEEKDEAVEEGEAWGRPMVALSMPPPGGEVDMEGRTIVVDFRFVTGVGRTVADEKEVGEARAETELVSDDRDNSTDRREGIF